MHGLSYQAHFHLHLFITSWDITDRHRQEDKQGLSHNLSQQNDNNDDDDDDNDDEDLFYCC